MNLMNSLQTAFDNLGIDFDVATARPLPVDPAVEQWQVGVEDWENSHNGESPWWH